MKPRLLFSGKSCVFILLKNDSGPLCSRVQASYGERETASDYQLAMQWNGHNYSAQQVSYGVDVRLSQFINWQCSKSDTIILHNRFHIVDVRRCQLINCQCTECRTHPLAPRQHCSAFGDNLQISYNLRYNVINSRIQSSLSGAKSKERNLSIKICSWFEISCYTPFI